MEQVNNNNIEEKLSTLNSQLSTNIYPIFDRMMTREDKERLQCDGVVYRVERFREEHGGDSA
mgnify:CR=1 FL=1